MGSPWLLGGPLAPSQSSLRGWGEGQGRYRLGGQSRAVLHGPPPTPLRGPASRDPAVSSCHLLWLQEVWSPRALLGSRDSGYRP